MVMGSLLGSEAYAMEQQDQQQFDPYDPFANTGDIPYAAPVYGPPAPTYGGINPNQGGFRDPVYNPANVEPGGQYAPNPDLGIVTPFHPLNEAASPYTSAAYDYVSNAAAEGFKAQNLIGAAGSYGYGYDPGTAGAVGGFIGGSLVPQSVEEALINSAGGGGITGYDDILRGAINARGLAEDVFRGAMPEPSLYPGLSAGVPPINPSGGENVFGFGVHGASPEDAATFAAQHEAALNNPYPWGPATPAEPRFPSSYPSIPEGTMGSEFPDVVAASGGRISPDSPAARMGAPLAYDPQFMTPPPADAAMRDLGLTPQSPLINPGTLRPLDVIPSNDIGGFGGSGEIPWPRAAWADPQGNLFYVPNGEHVHAVKDLSPENMKALIDDGWSRVALTRSKGEPKGVLQISVEARDEGRARTAVSKLLDAAPPADRATAELSMRGLGSHPLNANEWLGAAPPVDPLARTDTAQQMQNAFDNARRLEGAGVAPTQATPAPTSLTAEEIANTMRQADINAGFSDLNAPPTSTTGELNPVGTGQKRIEEAIAAGNLSPTQAEFLRSPNGQASAAQLGHTEDIIGRPLAPEETAAVVRRLETPANSPEGIAERAGVGQAPTRAQALEDAQSEFAQRVQDQAERFRAGNGRDMTSTEYQRMVETERVAAGIKPEQVRAGILDWLNLPRSLMTGMDLSFALRQMVLQAPAHPIEWAKSVGTGIRSALSEDYAMQVARRIENNPLKDVHKNLYVAPMEKGAGTIAQREEQYATGLLDRIPILGAIYRPFERGNTAMINQFRVDVADNFAKNTMALKGETIGNLSRETQRQIDIYDNFVNRATGRGTLGELDKSAVPLGQVFFSLRNTIAKPQVIASLASKPFTPAWNQMVKDTAGFLALGATTLYLADSAGLKVGVDPRSSDFGKIKVGDTHIDIWGGWQQQARAIFQTVQGARGESNFVSSSGKASTKSPLEIGLPWVGNRASPQAGLVGQGLRALAENKTDGGPVLDGLRQMFPDYHAPGLNVSTALKYLTPLSVQDTVDALMSEGIKGGLISGPLSFFGVGTQTYPDTSNPRSVATNQVMSKPENLAGLPPNVAAFLQDKSWNDATPKEQQAILAKLSPEERDAIAKGEQQLRDRKDIFQLSRDETKARSELADQQREALKPIADKLLEDWKSGAMPPEQALEAIKRVEARADKEAQFSGNVGPKLSESQAYQNAVKGFSGDKTDGQKEVDRIREIQGKYYSIYDDPRVTNPDGTKNWDKIEAAQKAIMDTLRKTDPGFANRVEFNLQKNPGSDYELTQWISKIDDRLNQAGYYDVPSGQKTAFARSHPDVDALLSAKYGNPVHTEQAAKILVSLLPERKVTYAK